MNSRDLALREYHKLPRERFLCLPTPLYRMNRLSAPLNADVWIKRDDLTGFAFGGNKGRKLQYLMADALAAKADCVVACGAIQSNHVRQTAAAAARFELPCTAVLLGSHASSSNGNLALLRWLGADCRFVGASEWEARSDNMWDVLDRGLHQTAEQFHHEGRRPYVVPLGGSTPLGAMGFVDATLELHRQVESLGRQPFDAIVFASSSGGTHSGLALGHALLELPTRLVGVCADPEDIRPDIAELATAASQLIGWDHRFEPNDLELTQNYAGPGYALPSNASDEAIRTLASLEGVFLDPVYTGKAMAGLLAMVRSGEFPAGSSVLFWHTGGTPTLFASEYAAIGD